MIVHLKDFMSHDGDTCAVRRAVESLKEGDTLCLGGGTLHLKVSGAKKGYYCISNNDRGEKPMAFPLIGLKHITIDGEGADLIFYGDILPVMMDGCHGVTVKNLSLDYESPRYSQAKILEADEEHTVLEFDGHDFQCRVKNGHLCYIRHEDGYEYEVSSALSLEFDANGVPSPFLPPYFPYSGEPRDHGFLGGMFRDVTYRQLEENRIAMYGKLGFTHTPGNYLVSTYSDRQFPGIVITESRDIRLENIQLYHTASMGVIGQLSENITLEKVCAQVRPGSGRLMSVNADATHFVNCRGKLTLKDCRFLGMMDDACNIHGIYLKAPHKTGRHTLEAGYGHNQQQGINLFRPGDGIRILDCETMETQGIFTVEASRLRGLETLEIVTREALPELSGTLVAENVDTNPEVLFSGCESGFNRPRGFLLGSAGKTVIENCTFYNMHQGINAGCEMKDWYESGPVQDVTIRHNRFQNSAYAGGNAISIRPNLMHPEKGKDFLGRMVIEDNVFVMNGRRFIHAENLRELILHRNRYKKDSSLPFHGELPDGGLELVNVTHADIEPISEE